MMAMALDQLYQQLILEHNRSPRNYGPLPGATHSARGFDALCGDDLLFELQVEDNRIMAAAFSGEACAVTKACASMLTEWLPGRDRADIERGLSDFDQVLEGGAAPEPDFLGAFAQLGALAAFPSRQRNARLPWRCALDALDA
ncbi:iron-sulfur cluster assembly scaffold protein [Wenzhouxiangella marina]|nr:iron-sulfur cluster assembly scaffold protein [Wenzhouxiangella marina]MBB6087509.1 nitrogen fixation NifU-like protein [Wenzhouxiangella marina]